MTLNEARASRRIYLALGGVVLASGALVLFVTALKGFYLIAFQQAGPGSGSIKAIVGWLYEHGIVISWLWPWMSDIGFGGTFNIPLSPSAITGLVLLTIAGFSFQNARRLARWIGEVRELLAKEEMVASQRPPSQRQTTGNIVSGGDATVTQQITNHYNHRPDSLKTPIVVALIGAVAVVIAALVRLWQ